MILLRLVSIFLILLLAVSCAMNREVNIDDNVVLDQSKGLVFISLTRSGGRDIPFHLLYRGIDDHNRFIKGKIPLIAKDDWVSETTKEITSKGDFEGRLVTLLLPVGKYEFYHFEIEDGYQDAEWSGGRHFSNPFVSTAFKTEYAGNIHLWSTEKSEEYDISYEHYHSDDRVRDVPFFRKKYPKAERVTYSIFESQNPLSDYTAADLTNEERRLLAFEPKDAESHKNRAFYYFGLEDYEKADYHSKKAIELDASMSDPYLYRALVFMMKENIVESMRFLNLSIDRNADNGLALVIRAFFNGSLVNKKQAKKDWEKAKKNSNELVKIFSSDPEVIKILESL